MEEFDYSEEEVRQRMKREIRACMEIKNLPNFITIYDYVVKDKVKYYILMELAQGPRLDLLHE